MSLRQNSQVLSHSWCDFASRCDRQHAGHQPVNSRSFKTMMSLRRMYKGPTNLTNNDTWLAALCSEKTAVIFLPFHCSDLQHQRRHFSVRSGCIPRQGHLRYTQTNPFIPTQQLQTSQCDATQKGEVAHCQGRTSSTAERDSVGAFDRTAH